MTPDPALRDWLAEFFVSEQIPYPDALADQFLADPQWTVTATPPCPTCEGTGEIMDDSSLMVEAPDGFLPDPCPTCHGTGYAPPEWATVDLCLDWLRERDHFVEISNNEQAMFCAVFRGIDLDGEAPVADTEAPTLHAACIAACVAVAERGQG